MFSISITHSGIVYSALFVLDLDLQSCKCIAYITDKCGNFLSMFESAKQTEFLALNVLQQSQQSSILWVPSLSDAEHISLQNYTERQ